MRKNTKKPFVRREEKEEHKINEKILAREIRLIVDGAEPMVLSTTEALRMAEEQELDLVEISPNAVPPVCRILDYRKFIYNQKKKQKELTMAVRMRACGSGFAVVAARTSSPGCWKPLKRTRWGKSAMRCMMWVGSIEGICRAGFVSKAGRRMVRRLLA